LRLPFFVALAQHVAHDVADDLWQLLPQAIHLALQAADLALKAIEPALKVVKPLIVTIEAGFNGCQIVAVTAGLLKDMPSDRFLALDLSLDHIDASLEMIKLVPCYDSHHSTLSNWLDSSIA
jgi:hypothetical protein